MPDAAWFLCAKQAAFAVFLSSYLPAGVRIPVNGKISDTQLLAETDYLPGHFKQRAYILGFRGLVFA